MEKPKPLEHAISIEDQAAPTTAFVALPDDHAAAERPSLPARGRSRWGLAASMLGPARMLTRLTSVDDEGDHNGRRHAQTMVESASSGLRPTQTLRPTPALLRAVSSFMSKPSIIEKFRCYVCYDDVPVAESVTLTTCGHRYCQSCFQSYLSIKINEGHVHPVCFHPVDQVKEVINADEENPAITMQKTCGVAVSDQQIESIVDTEVWAKFNRFRFNQEHEHARECPYCTFTQECVGPSNPTCVCGQCGKAFCFFHGNAHEDGTCADYELKNAEAEALNRAKINEFAKPCPGCTRDIEKNGGCNHMKCVVCETSFCWLCGEIIEDIPTPSHFDPANEGGCGGKQFDADPEADPASTWWGQIIVVLGYPLMLPFALVLTPLVWLCVREQSISEAFWLTYSKALYCFGFASALVILLVANIVDLVLFLVGAVLALVFVGVGLLGAWLFQVCCRRSKSSAS